MYAAVQISKEIAKNRIAIASHSKGPATQAILVFIEKISIKEIYVAAYAMKKFCAILLGAAAIMSPITTWAADDNTQIATVSGFLFRTPSAVAFTPDGKTAIVTDCAASAVVVVDVSTHSVRDSISNFVGVCPNDVAISPDGKTAYIANQTSPWISVIDIGRYTQTGTISLSTGTPTVGHPTGALSVAFAPDGKLAYIVWATVGIGGIDTVDATRNIRIGSVSNYATENPYGIAFTPDGKTAYSTHAGGPLSVIDVASSKQVAIVSDYNGVGLYGLAITPNGKTAYIPNTFNRTISIVDIASNKQTGTVANFIGAPVVDTHNIAISPDGVTAYVSNGSGGNGGPNVLIVNLATNTQLAQPVSNTPPNAYPTGIAFTPDGKTAYVATKDKDSNKDYSPGVLVINVGAGARAGTP